MKNFKYTTEEKRGKLCGKLINGINSLVLGDVALILKM